MIILNCKELANRIKKSVASDIKRLLPTPPSLVVVMVGNNAASLSYISHKEKACKQVGIAFQKIELAENATQTKLNQTIKALSEDSSVNGILLQLPLPKQLSATEAISYLNPKKDVDGLTENNIGKLVLGSPDAIVPCTVKGILVLLKDYSKEYNYELSGKHVVIINRSNLVGKPLSQLLLQENATVTICHSQTLNLKAYTQAADILISATGQKHFIDNNHIKTGSILIDVSIIHQNNQIFGDINPSSVASKAAALTPVPGGIGPLTVASLLQNIVQAHRLQNNINI